MTSSSSPPDIYYAVAHRDQSEIDSFASRYEQFDTAVIAPIFKQYLHLTMTSHRKSDSWGSSHVIYFVKTKERDDELVLRANLGVNPHPEVVMVTEKLITDQVAALDVPTNRVLEVDVSRQHYPFDFQIQEKLLGKDPEEYFDGDQAAYDRLSYQLGEVVARYHQLEFDKFGRFDEKMAVQGKIVGTKAHFFEYLQLNVDSDLEYLVGAKVITSKQARQVEQQFEDHQTLINDTQGVLVHHDLADHNLMFEGDRLTGIFDWEAAVVGDPALDLASCPTWRTHYPREKQLLAGYQNIAKLPDDFETRRNIYVLRTMLWKTVYAIRMDILNEKRAQRFKDVLKVFKI